MGIISGARGNVKTIETRGLDGQQQYEMTDPIGGIAHGIDAPPIDYVKTDRFFFNVKPMPPLKPASGPPRGTQFGYAGWIGKNILVNSHSTDYPGNQFKSLKPGEVVYVRGRDGKNKPYIVKESETFWYDRPASPYRGGLTDKHGHPYSWDAFGAHLVNKPGGSVIFHVTATSQDSVYGTHVITAIPAPETYGTQPPTPQVKAQRK